MTMTLNNGMYHVMDNYYIGIDEYSFIVYSKNKRERKEGDKKFNEYIALTYHSDLQDAVRSIHRRVVKDALRSAHGELNDLVSIYSSETKRLCTALSDAFPDVVVEVANDD